MYNNLDEQQNIHDITYDAENRLVEVKRGSSVAATFAYDHRGFRVKQTLDGTTTAFVGTYYEIGSEVTKYYYAAGQRVALRSSSQGVKYLLGDHLGSTSVTATVGGTYTRQLYTAWGEVRYSSGTLPTQYTYTGQYAWTSLGILYYNARNFDPALGRFLSADSVVPNAGAPGDYDRYSYVRNSPTMMVDPSGHRPVCEGMGSCTDQWRQEKAYQRLGESGFWKYEIKREFGITMSDSGDKSWDVRNLRLMYTSLTNVDKVLNGRFKSMAGGATFTLMNYKGDMEYSGTTHTDGTGIDFNTKGGVAIRQMNIYHEIGHLLDNAPGLKDVFTNAVKSPYWVAGDGYVNPDALRNGRVNDPNYGTAQAIQASEAEPWEQWADAFANYVAGNINMDKSSGRYMHHFVTRVLDPYIGTP